MTNLQKHAEMLKEHEAVVDRVVALERQRIIELLYDKAAEIGTVRIYNFVKEVAMDIDPETRKP